VTESAQDHRFYVWDTYWDANRVYSFGIEPASEAAAALQGHWNSIVLRLHSGAAVLDVGCGNGAAGIALIRAAAQAGGTVAITGVDEALINPPRYVPELAYVLGGIDFRPRTQMEAMPFEDGCFDAVVSQFGIEFGNPIRALAEVARVLRPKGHLSILALPTHSNAFRAAKKSVNQARYLLSESDLFGMALKMMQTYHAGPADSAEQKMQEDLAVFTKTVEAAFKKFDESEVGVLSVAVSCLYRVFTDRKTQPVEEQYKAIQTARTGVALYAARAQATMKAAIPDTNVTSLRSALAATGFRLIDARSLLTQGQLLAHQIIAERLEPQPQALPQAPPQPAS
jgi:ubiquinone/menaquinone biosynthesis C-methylase UbiE